MRRCIVVFVPCLVMLSLPGTPASSEEPLPRLLSAYQTTREQTQAERYLQQSRAVLLETLDRVEKQVIHQQQSKSVNWRKELHWDALVTEIHRQPPRVGVLQLMSSRLYGTTIGLEHPSLLALRQHLHRYIRAAKIAAVPDFRTTHQWHVHRLASHVKAEPQQRESDIARRHLAWLHWTGEPTELATHTREQATHPNFVLAVRKECVSAALDSVKRQVKETNDERRVVAGASVTGTVKITGTIQPVLKVVSDDPVLEVVFWGNTQAQNSRAETDQVITLSNCISTIEARTQIAWDGQQLVASPAEVTCETETTPISVFVKRNRAFPGMRGGLVDRALETAAMRRVQQQMPTAERESSELTERKVGAQMDSRVTKLVSLANEQIKTFYTMPLLRAGMESEMLLRHTENYLTIGLRQFDSARMAAETPHQLEDQDGNAVLCIHQSALTGFTKHLCGGAIWSDRDFAKLQRTVIQERNSVISMEDDTPWAVQLDWLQPFSTQINQDGIRFVLRVQAVSCQGEAVTCPVLINAQYNLKPTRAGLQFTRQGEVAVRCLDRSEENQRARTEMEQFLQARFAEFFLNEFHLDSLQFPLVDRLGLLGSLHVSKLRTHDGWLYLTIQDDLRNADSIAQQY